MKISHLFPIRSMVSRYLRSSGIKNLLRAPVRKQSKLCVLDKAFSDAKLKYEDIDLICLTGGGAKIPQIKKT